MSNLDPLEVRERINTRITDIEAETPEVFSVEDVRVEGVPLRVYRPGGGHYPVVLFVHGGAWVAGSLDTHDNLARYLCAEGQVVVVSVGYTNAPEAKFPKQLEQCWEALLWAGVHAEQIGLSDRVVVAGDSAGGNMAAALCLMARDRGGPRIDLQVLINPAPDLSCAGTFEPQGDELDELRWPTMLYVNTLEDTHNPYVSPMLADDLSGLPRALVLVAEFDDLRPEGERYAARLSAADVPTEVYCQMGSGHLAGDGARASDAATESLDIAVNAIRKIQRL